MKKILSHIVLAFIFATQAFTLAGCAHKTESFECKCDCNDNVFECTSNLKQNEPEAIKAVF